MTKRPLGERVASAFENGYGDEGLTAKLIHVLILAGFIGLSVALRPVMVVGWVRRKLRPSMPPSASGTSERTAADRLSR